MIISASYKTDIPTFYGEWFMRRLRAGYCKMVNPYGKQLYRVLLGPEHVDGIVFWTKNVGPFIKPLVEVKERGYPFVVQHTINGFPRALESRVVDAQVSVQHARTIREQHGPDALVWRYDTIVTSSITPPSFHIENFGRLADALRGVTNEVVLSFVQMYQKTKRNLDDAARSHGFSWVDPPAEDKRALLGNLRDIAGEVGMRVSMCAQPDMMIPNVGAAHCVDAERVSRIAGRTIKARVKGNRPGCGCYESRDIGDYDTCPHGCVYCYAVRSRELALRRFREHDPDSEFLYPPPPGAVEAAVEPERQRKLPLV